MRLLRKTVTSLFVFSLFAMESPVTASAKISKIPAEQLEGKTRLSVVPGADYEAGSLHTLIFGAHWRSLWTTPVEMPVLDLNSFGGGLVPFEKGGGLQTMTLSFRGANGKEYRFRSLDKDPSRGLPPKLKESVVATVLQDQVTTSNPVSGFIVSPLLDAAGVYNVAPEFAVLPYDKARLGEYFDEFCALAGTIEERPNEGERAGAGFKGADKISGTYTVFNNLEKDNDNQVDGAAYLRARLLDLFIGDWDRHSDQWKWAGYKKEGKTVWVPIPRDRDHAFSRQDGVFSWIITKVVPHMTAFGPHYPSIKNLSSSGRPLDRRLLSGIDRVEWDAVTANVKQKLTDQVIHEAVMKMPPAMYDKEGTQLENDLRSRRELLEQASAELYLLYAKDVDVYASNKAEYAKLHRMADGSIEVLIFKRDGNTGAEKGKPFYSRLFKPLETDEARLYLQGGDDRAVVDGPVCKGGVKVRVIGGDGQDTFEDYSSRALSAGSDTGALMTFFYDDGNKSEFVSGKYTSVDRHTVVVPADDQEKYDLAVRDAGREIGFLPSVDYSPDSGVFFGMGATLVDYSFRTSPYRYRMQLSGGVATGNDLRYKLNYSGDFRSLFRNTSLLVEASTTGLDFINFYGLGNEKYYNGTGLEEDNFEILNQLTSLRASLSYPMDRNYRWSAAVAAKWVDIALKPGSFNELNRADVPGINNDFAGSFQLGFHYDSRDSGDDIALSPRKPASASAAEGQAGSTTALSGIMVDLSGRYYPEFFGNEHAYEKIAGEFRTYIPLVSSRYSRLVLRFGGEKIWGDYPFYEAAFLGGTTSLRGYDKQRFAGDASLYAGSELRLYLGTFKFLVPVMYGPLAFAETGRVFLDGEDSSAWHSSAGGGLWFGGIESRYSASIAFAQGFDDGRLMEDYGIYLKAGFSF
jgi:Omp85 superfamily domain